MIVKNVEKKENNTALLQVEVDAESFEKAVNSAYKKLKGSIYVAGFRKGKAPRVVIEGMYGSDIFHDEAVQILAPEAFEYAVEQEKLDTVGVPSIADYNVDDAKALTITFHTELYPVVTLGQYKGLEGVYSVTEVTDEDVDKELADERKRNARYEDVDRPVQKGDSIVFDFEGFVDGVPFEGGKAENYSLEVGSGAFIPGFEDQLVGMEAEKDGEVHVTFPEQYAENLAGKDATFKVKIHAIREPQLPELDDEFAKDVSEYDTLAALKKSIKADLAKKRQEAVDRDFENEAVVLAGKNMTCDIPACMIDEQVDKHLEQFAYQLQSQGMKMEDYVKMIGGDVKGMRDSMRPMAEQTVRSNILLSEIVHQENIDVTDEEVEEELKKLAEQYKMELDKIKEMIDVEAVKSDLKGRKAVKLIVDNAKPVEKEKEKKAAKKASKKEDEAAEAPAEEAPKAEE